MKNKEADMTKECKEKTGKTKKGNNKGELEVSNKADLPELEINEEGVCVIRATSQEQINSVFGGNSDQFSTALLSHCINISGSAVRFDSDKSDALALVAEIAPTDCIEAMLATQMAAVHIAMMRHSRHLAGADNLRQLDCYERIFNKLGRTFAAQMEALRKHRNGGQQKVTVEHVTVNDGGQAIVGNVDRGGAKK